MAVDVELELQVLRLNVIGIRGDVHDLKARTDQCARYDRLQRRIEHIRERLAAIELRCGWQSLTAPEHAHQAATLPAGNSPEQASSLGSGRPGHRGRDLDSVVLAQDDQPDLLARIVGGQDPDRLGAAHGSAAADR